MPAAPGGGHGRDGGLKPDHVVLEGGLHDLPRPFKAGTDDQAVTRGMLRLYEREGLLAVPPRSAAGYRHYPADTAERLERMPDEADEAMLLDALASLHAAVAEARAAVAGALAGGETPRL